MLMAKNQKNAQSVQLVLNALLGKKPHLLQ